MHENPLHKILPSMNLVPENLLGLWKSLLLPRLRAQSREVLSTLRALNAAGRPGDSARPSSSQHLAGLGLQLMCNKQLHSGV